MLWKLWISVVSAAQQACGPVEDRWTTGGQPGGFSTAGVLSTGRPHTSTGYPPAIPRVSPQSVDAALGDRPQRYPPIMERCPRIMDDCPHLIHRKIFQLFSVHMRPQAIHRQSTRFIPRKWITVLLVLAPLARRGGGRRPGLVLRAVSGKAQLHLAEFVQFRRNCTLKVAARAGLGCEVGGGRAAEPR